MIFSPLLLQQAMNKTTFNAKLREFSKKLSPQLNEQNLVTQIYKSFNELLGINNCIQIGSYPRFTAITPLHDLDILYILGNWDEKNHTPYTLLKELFVKIDKNYVNPTNYKIEKSLQTHSVTVVFKDKNNNEIISIDIVPAYVFSKNEFKQDKYKVPEVIRKSHGEKRSNFYKKLQEEHQEMNWITSDPRGYIEIAERVNQANNDFRKTVKFIKAWKNSCKEKYKDFKLKSFHIEQVITSYFQKTNNLEIFDAIFNFFTELPNIIQLPQIKDRANNDIYIDDYLKKLNPKQKEIIIQFRDSFLIKLENFDEDDSIEELLEVSPYCRGSNEESFLFDQKIPTLTEKGGIFSIYGEAQERKGGFRKYILSKIGLIPVDRKIKFRINGTPPNVDLFKWKVKNDNMSPEPRGEITDNHTKYDPENTKYKGNHFVECYAILNSICVAKAKQNIKLER